MLWDQDLRPPFWLSLLLALGAQSGCRVIDDPDHCANRDGDATCEAEFPGRVCSTCQRAFSGCSEAPVEAACRPSSAEDPTVAMTSAETGSTGDTVGTGESGETGDGSTTEGPPIECEGEGASEACPEDRPYCAGGTCSGCDAAGGHAYCEGLDAARPQCNADWGRCVVCVDDTSPVCQAAGNFCTTEFTCGGCTRQAQCPDSACNVWDGACMDDADKLWIRPNSGSCNDSNAGSEPAPLCTVTEALSRLDGPAVFYLGNGRHSGFDGNAANTTLAIIGDGVNVFTESSSGTGDPGARFGNGAEIIIHNMRLNGTDLPALDCANAGKIALESVAVIGGAPYSVDMAACDLLLQRSRVTNAAQGALRFSGGPTRTLRLYSSTLALQTSDESELPTVSIDGGTIDIRGTTILSLEPGGKILGCAGNTAGTVHSALLTASPTSNGIDCPNVDFDHSLIDTTALDGEGLVSLPFTFTGWFRSLISDLRLRDDVDSVLELQDIGRWELGDPLLDYDGARLPTVPGTPIYPGGDQR